MEARDWLPSPGALTHSPSPIGSIPGGLETPASGQGGASQITRYPLVRLERARRWHYERCALCVRCVCVCVRVCVCAACVQPGVVCGCVDTVVTDAWKDEREQGKMKDMKDVQQA